jgi:thioredoxin 1
MAKKGKVIYLNDANFEESVAKGVTLVDFYADWCGPCKMIEPILDDLSEEMEEKVVIAKLDIEKALTITANFQVTSIPTLIVFKDGKEAKRIIGLRDKEALKSMINSVL